MTLDAAVVLPTEQPEYVRTRDALDAAWQEFERAGRAVDVVARAIASLAVRGSLPSDGLVLDFQMAETNADEALGLWEQARSEWHRVRADLGMDGGWSL